MKMNVKKIIGILFSAMFIFSAVYSETAVVTYVKGKVEVSRKNGWVQLRVGDKIATSDTISTGFQSEAKVDYNGSVMYLGALTRITLENLSSSTNKDNVQVYLKTGAVRSKVVHTQDKRVAYTVKSPVAVASVRGTDFVVTANGKIICNEGAVAVYSNRDSFNNLNSDTETTEEKDSEEKEKEADTPVNPKDNGPAKSTTAAEKIDATAPAGAVVVAKNQEVSMKSNGNPVTPMVSAIQKSEKAVNTVTTPAVQEAVSVGGTSTVSQAAVVEKESTAISTGSILATLVLED